MHIFEVRGGPSGKDMKLSLDGRDLESVSSFTLSCDHDGMAILDLTMVVDPIVSDVKIDPDLVRPAAHRSHPHLGVETTTGTSTGPYPPPAITFKAPPAVVTSGYMKVLPSGGGGVDKIEITNPVEYRIVVDGVEIACEDVVIERRHPSTDESLPWPDSFPRS